MQILYSIRLDYWMIGLLITSAFVVNFCNVILISTSPFLNQINLKYSIKGAGDLGLKNKNMNFSFAGLKQ